MNKKKRVRWGRVLIALIILVIIAYGIISMTRDIISLFKTKENVPEVQDIVQEDKQVETVVKTIPEVEPVKEEPKKVVEEQKVAPVVKEVKVETPKSKKYRLTSYYPEEGETCTGSGKCINNFQVNSKGWYTYNGKLVVAAATKECLNSHYGACNKWNTPKAGRKYFKYYEEIKIVIDGTTYDAIVLDSCGASMYLNEDRIDLFVSSSKYAIDRGYKGKNMITVYADYS